MSGHGPLPRGTRYNQLMAGLHNYYADQNVSIPKIALTMSDLLAIHRLVDHSTFEGVRNWCACTLAFFGLLRINEYMNSGLRRRHIQQTAWGVSITVPYSKTSLIPTRVDVVSRTDALCPSRALSAYLSFFVTYSGLPQQPDTPLFITRLPSGFTPMTDVEFVTTFRSYMQLVSPGCVISQYAGHSFRRGGTSALKLAGVSDSIIQQHGRWRSDAYRAYIDSDHNLAVRLLATQALPPLSRSQV
jgi:hypothetical protein